MTPTTFELTIDFRKDWKMYLLNILQSRGYNLDQELSASDISMKFFNIGRKYISVQRRKVFVSKELKCPKKYKPAFRKLIKKIEAGRDLTPHLSTKIKRPNFNDLLLNDWGIHHLHIHVDVSDRNKDLLFVKFESDKAYLIKFDDHNSFSKQELIEIMHNNWPDMMRKYKAPVDSTLGPDITDADRHNIRKHGSTTFVKAAPGVYYMPPGMGITSARTSVEATRSSQYYMNNISLFEKHVKDNIGQYSKKILERNDVNEIKKMNFVLMVKDFREFSTLETYSRTIFPLGNL